LVDYSLSGPNGFLAAGGARVVAGDVAISAGFGYANLANDAGSGVGALAAVDFGVLYGFSLRVQGSWRRGTQTNNALSVTEVTSNVYSAMGGLSLNFCPASLRAHERVRHPGLRGKVLLDGPRGDPAHQVQ